MKGTVLYGPGDIRFEDPDDPKIAAPTYAVIRMAATCVCGSDLWPYRQGAGFRAKLCRATSGKRRFRTGPALHVHGLAASAEVGWSYAARVLRSRSPEQEGVKDRQGWMVWHAAFGSKYSGTTQRAQSFHCRENRIRRCGEVGTKPNHFPA